METDCLLDKSKFKERKLRIVARGDTKLTGVTLCNTLVTCEKQQLLKKKLKAKSLENGFKRRTLLSITYRG